MKKKIPVLGHPVVYNPQGSTSYIEQVRDAAKTNLRHSPTLRGTKLRLLSAEWLLRATDPEQALTIRHIAGAPASIPPEKYGGAEIIERDLIQEQRRMGHDVQVYAPGSSNVGGVTTTIRKAVLEDNGGRWEHQGRFMLHYTACFRNLRHEIAGMGGKLPDFVIGHLTDPYSPILGEILGQYNSLGIPSLIIKHSPLNLNDRYFENGQEKVIDQEDPTYLQWYWSQIPLIAFGPVDRAETIKNFPGAWVVDEIPLALSDESFLPLRPRINAVGIMGRVEHNKGQADAIRMAKAIGLNILVAGPITDPVYFKEQVLPQIDADLSGDPQRVAALLSSTDDPLLKNGPKAIYLGPIGGENKDNFLARILVGLAPIDWEEPGGTFHVELLAAGTPLVAYRRGCVEGQIAPHRGQWGFDVTPGDEPAFKAALQAALKLNNNAQIQQWAREEIHVSKATQRYDMLMRFLIALHWANGGWKI
jgi:glycosyltransferase involved in cell wall biosynthesis